MCKERLCMLHPWKLLSCIYVGMQICRSFLLGLCGGEPVHICKGSFSLISRQQVADNKINTYKINHHYLELIRLRIRIIRSTRKAATNNNHMKPEKWLVKGLLVSEQHLLEKCWGFQVNFIRFPSSLPCQDQSFPIYICYKNLTPSITVF